MSNITKRALADSLKKLLLKKPLTKITINDLTHDLIMGVVEEQSVGTSITQEQKSFIADFYKYSFVGIMLDWIRQGMKSDYTDIWKNMCITLHGNITNSIQNFTKHDK